MPALGGCQPGAVDIAAGIDLGLAVLAVVAAAPGSAAVNEVASTRARQPDVAHVAAPSSGVSSPLVSADGRSVVVAATLRSAPDASTAVDQIKKALAGRHDVTLGGV